MSAFDDLMAAQHAWRDAVEAHRRRFPLRTGARRYAGAEARKQLAEIELLFVAFKEKFEAFVDEVRG